MNEKHFIGSPCRICGHNIRYKCDRSCVACKNNGGQRERNLKHKYKLTIDSYNEKLIKQDNCCAICKTTNPGNGRYFAVDHDHSSSAIRGLLCNNCNKGLGNFLDDIALLEEAIKYLKKYQQDGLPPINLFPSD